MPNGLELSRPTALGSPSPTLRQSQCAFEAPFSRAVEVGSSELLGADLVLVLAFVPDNRGTHGAAQASRMAHSPDSPHGGSGVVCDPATARLRATAANQPHAAGARRVVSDSSSREFGCPTRTTLPSTRRARHEHRRRRPADSKIHPRIQIGDGRRVADLGRLDSAIRVLNCTTYIRH